MTKRSTAGRIRSAGLLAILLSSLAAPSAAAPADPQPMSTANRTRGVAPLGVFFDAVDSADPLRKSGVLQPADEDFASLHYEWDFGDARAGKWATSGRSRNRDTGCVAAHVYDAPGDYSARLTVVAPSGASTTYVQKITVEEFSGTTSYISSAGDDAADGKSPKTAWKTLEKAIQNAGTQRRFLFRRGDTFTTVGPNLIQAPGPGILGAFGEGAAPRIQVTGTTSGIGLYGDDWRVMDLEFVGPGSTDKGSAVYLSATRQVNRSLLYRLTSSDFRVPFGWSDQEKIYKTPHEGNMVVECSVPRGVFTGMYIGGVHLALLGCTVRNIEIEHCVRVWQAHRAVLAHNVLENPGRDDRHALKLHGPVNGDGRPPTRYVEISDNSFAGKVWSVAIGPQNGVLDERLSQIVFERNRTRSYPSLIIDVCVCAREVTIRNNVFVGTGSSKEYFAINVDRRGIEPPPASIRILNNTVLRDDSGKRFSVCKLTEVCSDVTVANNLASAPGVPERKVVIGTCTGLSEQRNVMADAPGLRDPAKGDFRPAAGSPALGAGGTLPHVRTDFAGEKVSKERPDAGALQHGP